MASIYIKDPEALPKRREHDFYGTADVDVERGLDFLWDTIASQGHLPPGANLDWQPCVLDPGTGEGPWGAGIRKRCNPSLVLGFEVREVARPEAYDEWVISDFLAGSGYPLTNMRLHGYDLVIGNPPYAMAEQFVRRSLQFLKDGGYLLFLLRLTFLESQKRATGLFQEHPPLRIGVCGKRPSFSGNGRTSPDAYMYCIWKKDWQGETSLTWV